MKFKTISFEEYKKIETMLLTSVEDLKEEVYKDSRDIATIGIGINIESNEKLWHYLILYHLFGLTKDLNDIPLKMIDTKLAIQTQIVHQFTGLESYKNNEYEILIDDIVERYKKEEVGKLTKEKLKEYLNQNIKDAIQFYLKQSQQMQNKNPKTSLKEFQRLSEEDLKINKSEAKNPKYLEFKLSKEQAKELLGIMMINYELSTLRILKNNQEINQFEYKEKADRKWYKELIPFVSATYNSQNYIKQNLLLKKAFNIYESRFFIWAIIRYDFIIDAKRKEVAKWKMFATRMLKQACIFNLNQKLDKEKENDEEKFRTCVDVFKVLNLIHPHIKQTYFSYFKKQDKIMLNSINDIKTEYDNKNAKNYINDDKYEIYRLGYINSNELQALNNILNPYVCFLDELIPCAKFENNQDFTRYKLLYYDSQLKEKESILESRFKPENIYIIDRSNFNESLKAINSYINTQKTKENILILIIETIDTTIKINRANNTYLYLVSVKNNHFDCSFINNPLNENTTKNDKAELFLCEIEDKPKIISLATKALQMQQDNDRLSAIYNNMSYIFNPLNHLTINKERERIFTLSNYRFYLQKQYNDKVLYHTLDTILKPNQLYSTLGIELITPKEQDSFCHDGNFTIHLNCISLNQIQNETNHTITKDTPIFAYVQENKQNFITKLQDKTLSFPINIQQILTKDERGKNELIDTKNIFLSYIPFQNNEEANNTSSQKLQLDAKDLEKGSKSIDYKIPYANLEESRVYGGWEKLALKEQELPDNVIRIETLDGSGEFIEIEFDESVECIEKSIEDEDLLYEFVYDENNQIADTSETINQYNALMGNETRSDVLNARLGLNPRVRYKDSKRPHGRSIKAPPQYARTKKDVIKIVDNLEVAKRTKGINKRVRLVETKKELDELWERLTKNAKKLKDGVDKRYGNPIYKRELNDGTSINYRVDSRSGGETIDIHTPNERNLRKMHIKSRIYDET